MKNIKLFKIMFKYLKKYKFLCVLYIFLTILFNIMPIITAFFWANVIESLNLANQSKFLFFLVCYSTSQIIDMGIIQLFIDLIYNKLQMEFVRQGSYDLYNKIINLPAIAFEDMGVGELTNRLNNDLERIISLIQRIIDLASRFILAICILIYAFVISVFVGLELIAFGIVMYLLANVYYPKIKKIQEEISKQSDKYIKKATEDFIGIREIRALGIKDSVSNRMKEIIDSRIDKEFSIERTIQVYYSLNNILYFILFFIMFLTIGTLIFTGHTVFALFLIMQNLIMRFDSAIESLSDFGVNYNKVIVSLRRIDDILNNKLYKDDEFGDRIINESSVKITFKDVKFKYRKGEKYTLNGLSMIIKPHQKVAIVGKSGQGKSTIFNLLMRYFDIKHGSIKINDIDIKDLSEDSLRSTLSIIRQDPYLFNQSIFDNFKMVKEDVTLKEVREVCKKAYIDDYIMSLPKKYNTIIGEGGVNLSGGQKQRIAIARTLLKNTKVILFDEATSALDNESQEYIKKTIDDLVKTHTIIIVAHRLSTIMDADVIHLIDGGKVVESGNHDKLMKKSKLYKHLYNPEVIDKDEVLEY